MTRAELQILLNEIYGADVRSDSRYWNMRINTTPPREILFTKYFVEEFIGEPGQGLGQLREMLIPVAGCRHVQDEASKKPLFIETVFSADA